MPFSKEWDTKNLDLHYNYNVLHNRPNGVIFHLKKRIRSAFRGVFVFDPIGVIPQYNLSSLDSGDADKIVDTAIQSFHLITQGFQLWNLLLHTERKEINYDCKNRFHPERTSTEYFTFSDDGSTKIMVEYNCTEITISEIIPSGSIYLNDSEKTVILKLLKPRRGERCSYVFDMSNTRFYAEPSETEKSRYYISNTEYGELPDIGTGYEDLHSFAFQQSLVHDDAGMVIAPIMSLLIDTCLPIQFTDVVTSFEFVLKGKYHLMEMMIQEQNRRIDEYYNEYFNQQEINTAIKKNDQIQEIIRELNAPKITNIWENGFE